MKKNSLQRAIRFASALQRKKRYREKKERETKRKTDEKQYKRKE